MEGNTSDVRASTSTPFDGNAHSPESRFEETGDLVMRKIRRSRRNSPGEQSRTDEESSSIPDESPRLVTPTDPPLQETGEDQGDQGVDDGAQAVEGAGDKEAEEEEPPEPRTPSPEPVPDDNEEPPADRPDTPIDPPPQEAEEGQEAQEVDDGTKGTDGGEDQEEEVPPKVPPKVRPPSMEPVIHGNGETPPADRTTGTGKCGSDTCCEARGVPSVHTGGPIFPPKKSGTKPPWYKRLWKSLVRVLLPRSKGVTLEMNTPVIVEQPPAPIPAPIPPPTSPPIPPPIPAPIPPPTLPLMPYEA